MGSPNTGPLVQITPNDGNMFRGVANITDTALTVNVTVFSREYGEQTYDMIVPAHSYRPNDCKVNSATATCYGYLMST